MRQMAIAAAPTPRTRASITSDRPSPNVLIATSAASSAGASRTINDEIRGGSARPPSRTGPIALMAIVATPTRSTTSQVVVIASTPTDMRRSRR